MITTKLSVLNILSKHYSDRYGLTLLPQSLTPKLRFNFAACRGLGIALFLVIPASKTYADNNNWNKEKQRHLTIQSLDGSENNRHNPHLGMAGTQYTRVANAAYADGIGLLQQGPELRYISNRIFADGAQNLFSEISTTQWVYNWGQFIDHTVGLRENGTENVEISFNDNDPLEQFSNSSENLTMTRTAVAPNSGETTPREQINTVSSYIDAWAVYGGTDSRLEWLRAGPVDGDMSNNSAYLLMTEDNHLPTASIRGDATLAPEMEIVGRLHAIPNPESEIIVTGDKRANENIALTTVQTLFAREHNRIVSLLPKDLTEQERFDIARQIVIATQQYITYNEFLPAVGVYLNPAKHYNDEVDPSITNEFATVGYRAHSMIHGEIELEATLAQYSESQIESFANIGIELEVEGDDVELAVPLNVAFANPQLAASLGIGAISAGLGGEPQYKNDEQIDNQLRSVLFQLPNPDIANPDACLDGIALQECFMLVSDLGSLDVFRARDHGIPSYNDLREAYGLERIKSFSEITGEASEEFPTNDPLIEPASAIDDPNIMDFIELRDKDGQLLELGSDAADAGAVTGIRRTTLAARLKAIYKDVNAVDAFVGMVSEPHLIGSDLGELQHTMWKRQFEAIRDGDAYFYKWNTQLKSTMRKYRDSNIDYRQTLSDIIINNTELNNGDIQENMFLAADE